MKISLAVTPFAKWTKTELVLNNGVVQRIIKLPSADSTFLTLSYKPVAGDFKYFPDENTDFQFEVNGITYSGMKEFIIDDGWQDNYGDWGIDKKIFPNGLKPVFDHIKSLGMKPGLWVSVGSASPESKVYSEHPGCYATDHPGHKDHHESMYTNFRTPYPAQSKLSFLNISKACYWYCFGNINRSE